MRTHATVNVAACFLQIADQVGGDEKPVSVARDDVCLSAVSGDSAARTSVHSLAVLV